MDSIWALSFGFYMNLFFWVLYMDLFFWELLYGLVLLGSNLYGLVLLGYISLFVKITRIEMLKYRH